MTPSFASYPKKQARTAGGERWRTGLNGYALEAEEYHAGLAARSFIKSWKPLP